MVTRIDNPSDASGSGDFIRKDGITVTTASIPFALGLSLPVNQRISFGSAGNTFIEFDAGVDSLVFWNYDATDNQMIFASQGQMQFTTDDNFFADALGDLTFSANGATEHFRLTTSGVTVISAFSIVERAPSFQVENVGGTDILNLNTATGVLTLDGTQIIDSTAASAFLVRQNGGGTTIFKVDTSTPAVTIQSFTGILKGTAGVVSVASGGSDYEVPLTFTAPLVRTVNTISFDQAFNFSWTGTHNFANTVNFDADVTHDLNSATALTVRKDASGGNVLVIDTNSANPTVMIDSAAATNTLLGIGGVPTFPLHIQSLQGKRSLFQMSGSAALSAIGAWGGGTITITNTQTTGSANGTGLNVGVTHSLAAGTHTGVISNVTGAGQNTGTTRILSGNATMNTASATAGQAQGGFLQMSSPSAGAAAGYIIGLGRGASGVASNPLALDLLGIGISYLSNDTTGVAYGLQMIKGATVPATAYMLHGFGHIHTLDDDTWDIGTDATHRFRNGRFSTSLSVIPGTESVTSFLVEETGGNDIFLVDNSTPTISIGTTAALGVSTSFFTSTSGAGMFWTPNATTTNPIFKFAIQQGKANHIEISGTDSTAAAGQSYIKVNITQNYSGATNIIALFDIDLTDSRTLSSGGLDFRRVLDFQFARTSFTSSVQSHSYEGAKFAMTDTGTYSRLTGIGNTGKAIFIEATVVPTISATSGTGTYAFSGVAIAGSFFWNNAFTTFTIKGYDYSPSVSVGAGTSIEYAFYASRSGLSLHSDGTAGTYTGGNIKLGLSLDWDIFFEADNEAVNNIPTGAVYDFRINNADILSLAAATLTFSDAVNIVFNATTGTKIATATTQKLAFWNATPIVQPTTGVAAATFVANTSGIVNDTATWDGYTIGKVVKALRNTGLLA